MVLCGLLLHAGAAGVCVCACDCVHARMYNCVLCWRGGERDILAKQVHILVLTIPSFPSHQLHPPTPVGHLRSHGTHVLPPTPQRTRGDACPGQAVGRLGLERSLTTPLLPIPDAQGSTLVEYDIATMAPVGLLGKVPPRECVGETGVVG